MWVKYYFIESTVLTQKLVRVLNQDSDDLHRSLFLSSSEIQENSAYTEVGFSPKSGFTETVLTPKFPLKYIIAKYSAS